MRTLSTPETKRNQIQNAYAYSRVSSKKQLAGSGIERQAGRPENICEQFGWTLSDLTFTDYGVSAFKGTNRLRGDLATFIQLAQDGKLLPHPVLILEAWDRFSRQDIDESEKAIMDLLKTGVAIHIAFSGQTFTKASTVSIGDRVSILIACKAAFEYSSNLSKRVSAAKSAKFETIANGGSANISENAPSWVTWDKTTQSFIRNGNALIVLGLIRDITSGKSINSIVRELNQNKTPSFYGGSWSSRTVKKILSNQALLGLFRGKAIFPALTDADTFKTVKAILERNRGVWLKKGQTAVAGQTFGNRGRRADLVNIFRSMVFCAECKKPVYMTKKVNRKYAYYRCVNKQMGTCTQSHLIRADEIELHIFACIFGKDPLTLISKADPAKQERLQTLETIKGSLTRKIALVLDMDGDFNATELKAKYASLKTELAGVEKELAQLQDSMAIVKDAPEAISKLAKMLNPQDPTGDSGIFEEIEKLRITLQGLEIRNRLQVIMPAIIKAIFVDFNGNAFRVVFQGGKEVAHPL